MKALTLARPGKLTHAQTLLYEIDSLRFAAGRLTQENTWGNWLDLECFLLHFRNLIEFFGNPNPRRDNLTILDPESLWPDSANKPTKEILGTLYREDLWKKYEVRLPREVNDKISRYLQHCTKQRIENKAWKVREMYQELVPVMRDLEKILPDKGVPWQRPRDNESDGITRTACTATNTVLGETPPRTLY